MSFQTFIWLLYLWSGYSHFNPDGSVNDVLYLGYNVGPGGVPVQQGEHAFFDSWESRFQTAGTHLTERHWQYVGDDGTSRRPLSAVVDLDTHEASVGVIGNFVVQQPGSPSFLAVRDSGVGTGLVEVGTATQDVVIRIGSNGSGGIQQLNNGAPFPWYQTLIRMDPSNAIVIGEGPSGRLWFGAPERPVATSCEEIGAALQQLGLIVWSPAP